MIIQFVALFVLCGKLFRKELHQLVYGEMAKKQRTGNPYVSFVSFAIGTVILLVAYWIVVEHFMAASGAMLLIAVLLGIIGTILFIRGLARILSIWAASIKHKATRGLYVFTLRQLHENVVNKYISISVASILMMLAIMLITDGSVRIMSYGSELTRGTSVYDFTVMGNDQIVEKYLSNEQIRPYVSNLNRMEIGNIKSTASDGISSPVDWSKFRKQIVQHLPQDVVDPATQEDGMYSFGSDQPAALNLLGLIDTGSSSPYLLACALLALQFLTQMQTTKSRYLTLSILGARREQIKRSINQQVLWYFLLPLILACISGAVGIYAMQLYLYSGAAHLEQSYPLLIAMAVIVVLVMVIYGVAVARTANREIGKLNYKPNS